MNTANGSQDLLNAWLDVQKAWWDQVSQFSQAFSSLTATPTVSLPDWNAQLDQWRQHVAAQTPVHLQPVLQRILTMSQVYLDFAQHMYGTAQATDAVEPVEAWLSTLEKNFLVQSQQAQANPWNGFGLMSSILEGWQSLAMLSSEAQHWGQYCDGQTIQAQDGLKYLTQALQLPKVSNVDLMSTWQTLPELGKQYQAALEAFIAALAQQGLEAVQGLRARLWHMAAEGRQVKSLRELYDLWVTVSEEVYGRFALSDQYQVVYGDLINVYMALRRQHQLILNQQLRLFGLPNADDLNATYHKQQELKRENRQLRRRVEQLEHSMLQLQASLKEP